jgi:hypothetical protein
LAQIGWIDPASGTAVAFDTALDDAREVGSWAGIPYEVLKGIYDQEHKDRPTVGFSATQLLGCPRKVHLEKQAEYHAEPLSGFAAFRGVLAHSMMEDFKSPETTVERRFWRTYKGHPLSGQIDSVRVVGEREEVNAAILEEWIAYCDAAYEAEKAGQKPPKAPTLPDNVFFLIRDWKTKHELPTYTYVALSYQKQGNLYRWLMRLPRDRVVIEFVFVSMEGVRTMPLYNGGTFRNGRAKPEQVWTDRKVEEFLDDRLMTLVASQYAGRPLPYDMVPNDDLWNCNYCPAKSLCYDLAAKEAHAAWLKGEEVNRIPPREKEKS